MMKLVLILVAALCLGAPAHAAGGGIPLDKFPKEKLNDMAALQNGAKLFANYCLNCHEASFMRYNRLRDIGLSNAQIESNLIFNGAKVGDTMKTSMLPADAKSWFGKVPPDLTLVARSRSSGAGSGADYLYTYMRTYFVDDTKATGWDNLAFPGVGMPHVLWELQGLQRPVFAEQPDPANPGKTVQVFQRLEPLTEGTMSPSEYANAVADLVAFMSWMAEPMRAERIRLGIWVMMFLLVFTFIAWRLNASFWKDIR